MIPMNMHMNMIGDIKPSIANPKAKNKRHGANQINDSNSNPMHLITSQSPLKNLFITLTLLLTHYIDLQE